MCRRPGGLAKLTWGVMECWDGTEALDCACPAPRGQLHVGHPVNTCGSGSLGPQSLSLTATPLLPVEAPPCWCANNIHGAQLLSAPPGMSLPKVTACLQLTPEASQVHRMLKPFSGCGARGSPSQAVASCREPSACVHTAWHPSSTPSASPSAEAPEAPCLQDRRCRGAQALGLVTFL